MSLFKRCQWYVMVLLRIVLLLLVLLCNETNAVGNNATIESDILHFSYELERWLDTSIRPCQNFYDFVCGKSLNISERQLEMERKQKFEEFLAAENDERLMDSELKLKHFFASCKEARSTEDLKSTLMYRNSGGWPAIDDAAVMIRKRRNMTWLGVLGSFHEAGFEYFFKTRVEIKSNKRILHLEPDSTMRYTLRKFEQLAGEILQEHAVEAVRARLVELEILNFERNRRELAKATVEDVVQEFSYQSLKTTVFASVLQLEWDTYFKRALGKTPKSSDTVLVRQLPKLVQYFELLQNTTMTRFLNWIWLDYLMDKSLSECQNLVRVYFEPVFQHIVERAVIDKVQIAQTYSDIERAYDELLPGSPWIDEMSQRLSKQFHGRVMHLTLNGDTQLDADLGDLTITKRNFYRNIEKIQRHLMMQKRRQQQQQFSANIQSHEVSQTAAEFMQVLLTVGALLQQQNLTTPLNYILVGERFAEYMIASGSTSTTPGAWRSMDSEREFAMFRQCLATQSNETGESLNYNLNDLLLHVLAQHQTLRALDAWLSKNAALWQRLDRLLAAGRLQLTLRKLYFVGALLTNCRHIAGTNDQRQFVHSYLRNSQAFTQAFGCRASDKLYAKNLCKVF